MVDRNVDDQIITKHHISMHNNVTNNFVVFQINYLSFII